jgi:hypothetical protein
MKKVIPERIANKVYDKMLCGVKNRWASGWVEGTLYKPGTTKISNKFFKNKVTRFTYKCRCEYCVEGKLASTRKRWESTQEQLNDYL